MALDTAEKRRSAAGVAFLPFGPGVTPAASPGQAWRQEAAWSYSGILAGAAVSGTPRTPKTFTVPARRNTFTVAA